MATNPTTQSLETQVQTLAQSVISSDTDNRHHFIDEAEFGQIAAFVKEQPKSMTSADTPEKRTQLRAVLWARVLETVFKIPDARIIPIGWMPITQIPDQMHLPNEHPLRLAIKNLETRQSSEAAANAPEEPPVGEQAVGAAEEPPKGDKPEESSAGETVEKPATVTVTLPDLKPITRKLTTRFTGIGLDKLPNPASLTKATPATDLTAAETAANAALTNLTALKVDINTEAKKVVKGLKPENFASVAAVRDQVTRKNLTGKDAFLFPFTDLGRKIDAGITQAEAIKAAVTIARQQAQTAEPVYEIVTTRTPDVKTTKVTVPIGNVDINIPDFINAILDADSYLSCNATYLWVNVLSECAKVGTGKINLNGKPINATFVYQRTGAAGPISARHYVIAMYVASRNDQKVKVAWQLVKHDKNQGNFTGPFASKLNNRKDDVYTPFNIGYWILDKTTKTVTYNVETDPAGAAGSLQPEAAALAFPKALLRKKFNVQVD